MHRQNRQVQSTSYFDPLPTAKPDQIATKFPPTFGMLSASYHNAFRGIFGPHSQRQYEDSFRLFPAMALFRQSIELLIKAIIVEIYHLRPNSVFCTHNVADLYQDHISTRAATKLSPEDASFLSEALKELQSLDQGTGFRFGLDRQMKPCLDGQPAVIDGDALYESCEKLWNTLFKLHGPTGP